MYVKITSGIPTSYTIGQLRKDNPNVSFPRNVPDHILADYDVYPLADIIDTPYDPATQVKTRGDISFVEGAWRYTEVVRDKTADELAEELAAEIRRYQNAVQNYLDTTAREKGYDSIISLCTYATSSDAKFSAEGQAGVKFRDAVWVAAQTTLNEYQAGNIAKPTTEELIAALPTMTWA